MRRARFVAIPEDLYDRLLDAGLSGDAVALIIGAYTASSRGLLDGRVPLARLRRDPHWTSERQAELVAAGFLLLDADAVLVTGYLDVNQSREEIESRAGVNRENARQRWHPDDAGTPLGEPPEAQRSSAQRSAAHSAQRIPIRNASRTPTRIDDGEVRADVV